MTPVSLLRPLDPVVRPPYPYREVLIVDSIVHLPDGPGAFHEDHRECLVILRPSPAIDGARLAKRGVEFEREGWFRAALTREFAEDIGARPGWLYEACEDFVTGILPDFDGNFPETGKELDELLEELYGEKSK